MISDDQLRALRQQAPPPSQKPAATAAQLRFLIILIEERVVPEPWLLHIKVIEESGEMTKRKASEVITKLRALPWKPKDPANPPRGLTERSHSKITREDVPTGRYCIQTGLDEEDLSFYRIKWGKMTNVIWISRIGGPNEYPIRSPDEKAKILKDIYRNGAAEAATRYGFKVGRCSVCHTRITNRLSRSLGVGPVCGGRFFSDWKERVNKVRSELVAQGLDPNENIED